MRLVYNGSYKQYSPKLSNCIMLDRHIISLEPIQQIQEKFYCTCKIHQSDRETV